MADNISIDSIGHELKALNHIMHRKMLNVAKDNSLDNVTVMHGWIICFLYNNRDRNIFQKDIESEFSISRSTVTNILKLMEKKGYIKRSSVNSDARLKKIMLTGEGIAAHELIELSVQENENRFNEILDKEETKTFIYLIKKLRNGLEKN